MSGGPVKRVSLLCRCRLMQLNNCTTYLLPDAFGFGRFLAALTSSSRGGLPGSAKSYKKGKHLNNESIPTVSNVPPVSTKKIDCFIASDVLLAAYKGYDEQAFRK